MTPEEQRTVDAVTKKLLGEVYIGMQVQWVDGRYTVLTRGATEVRDYGRVKIQYWVAGREDGFKRVFTTEGLLAHRV